MFAEFGVLNYLTYLVGAVFIILVPGPNTFFVLKTGIAHGVKKGYLAAAGVFIGDAVLMFLAFAGVATLIKTTPVLFNVVRYLGAISAACSVTTVSNVAASSVFRVFQYATASSKSLPFGACRRPRT